MKCDISSLKTRRSRRHLGILYIFLITVSTWHDHFEHATTKNSCEEAR